MYNQELLSLIPLCKYESTKYENVSSICIQTFALLICISTKYGAINKSIIL